MDNNTYQEIENIINKLEAVDAKSTELNNLKHRLKEGKFNLVVIGQFKRGKSTFINSLLGSDILPTAILPLTSIVTTIDYSDEIRVVIKYNNEKKDEEISLSEIEKYVTERYNPENRLHVKEVDVFYPSEYLKSGIRIIDTPGVGSIFKHNTDVAYDYLPNCDAAIFMMSPDPPISQAELEFLRSAREYIDKFFFVLNKKDIVSSRDLKEVIAFNKHLLEEELHREIEIVPISALMALEAKNSENDIKLVESNIKAVEGRIIEPLKREKGKLLALSVINSLIRYTDTLETTNKLRQKAEELSVEELEKRIKEFKEFREIVDKYEEENEFVLKGKIETLYKSIDEDISSLKEQKLPELVESALKTFNENLNKRLRSEQLENTIKEKMLNQIKDIFIEFKSREIELIKSQIEEIYKDLSNRTNEIIKKIIDKASSIFEIDLKPFTTVEGLTELSEFSFKFEDQLEALAIIGTFIRRKLPLFVGKGVIIKHIKTTTEETFERHCGRIRYAFIKNIQETTLRFRRKLNDKIEHTISTIENILERTVTLKTESEYKAQENLLKIKRALSTVEECRLQLTSLKEKLEG